jgi:hypothetical protein
LPFKSLPSHYPSPGSREPSRRSREASRRLGNTRDFDERAHRIAHLRAETQRRKRSAVPVSVPAPTAGATYRQ